MPTTYFWGQSVTGSVRQSPAQTFRDVVDSYIMSPVPLPLTQAEFHALSKAERSEVKKTLPYLVPCAFRQDPSPRDYASATTCNLLFLDIDQEKDGVCPAAPFLKDPASLARMLAPYSFCAYKTVSSTPDAPRMRIVVAAHQIPLDGYAAAVTTVARRIGLKVVTPESKTAVQPMFLPSLFAGQNTSIDHPYVTGDMDGEPFIESDIEVIEDDPRPRALVHDKVIPEGVDFLAYLRPPVEEITMAIATEALKAINPDLPHPEWVQMAAALKHQFSPDDVEEAFEAFNDWSALGSKFKGRDATLYTWNHIKPTPVGRVPVTIRTLLHTATNHGWQGSAVKELCFGATMTWINDDRRTSTDLLAGAVQKVAATPLLSHVEEDALLNAAVRQARARHGLTISLSSLRQDLKRLREAMRNDSRAKDEKGKLVVPPWLAGWNYISSANVFFKHNTSEKLIPEAFDRTFSSLCCPDEAALEEAGLPVTPANLSKPILPPQHMALNTYKIKRVYDFDYNPAEPNEVYTQSEGKEYINTYRRSYPTPQEAGSAKAAAVLHKHLEHNFADPVHRRILLDWMAYMVQYPGRRIRWAVLIQGGEGCGKTFFANLMAAVLGREHVKLVDKGAIEKGWSEWAEGSQLVAIEEIRVAGTSRHDVMNMLKPLITNDRVVVNQRRMDTRTIRNVTNYILFSNFHDALALASGDRRYFVLKSRLQTKEDVLALGPDYFAKLFSILSEHASGLRYFLENHPISDDFQPDGHAPRTRFLDEVIDDTSDELTATIKRLIEEGGSPLVSKDLIGATTLNNTLTLEGVKVLSSQYLASVLRNLNYHKFKRMNVDTNDRQYVWLRNGCFAEGSDIEGAVRERVRVAKELEDVM